MTLLKITIEQSKSKAIYTDAGFNFLTTWKMSEGAGFPYLFKPDSTVFPDTPVVPDIPVIPEASNIDIEYIRILNKITKEEVVKIYDVIDPLIYEQINGQHVFTFGTIIDKNAIYYNENNILEVDGDYFNISRIVKDRSNIVTMELECEHFSYSLIGNDDEEATETLMYNTTPREVAEELLIGTGFVVGEVHYSHVIDYQSSAESVRDKLINLADMFYGELLFHKNTVNILGARGKDRGLVFSIGKNVKGIKEEYDTRGKMPRRAYEIDVIDLSNLPNYEEWNKVNLGDHVTIIDELLGINIKLRVVSYERNPFKKVNPKIQIGQIIRDLFNSADIQEADESGFVNIKKHFDGVASVKFHTDGGGSDYKFINASLEGVSSVSFDTEGNSEKFKRISARFYGSSMASFSAIADEPEIKEEEIIDDGKGSSWLEYGTANLASEMTFTFKNTKGYDRVVSVTTGVRANGITNGLSFASSDIVKGGKVTGIMIKSNANFVSVAPNTKVSMQATCENDKVVK